VRTDVQRIVRWVLPLLMTCAVSSCGSSGSGAPIDTPAVSNGVTTTEPRPVSAPTVRSATSTPTDSTTTTSSLLDEQRTNSNQLSIPPLISPPTTALAIESIDVQPPVTPPPAPEVTDASVLALAAVLGVTGEVEPMDGGGVTGRCVGRLEPRGLCVNVPLPETWQYWDLEAQNSPGAGDQQAIDVALDLFARIGVEPGVVTSVEPNGPLPQVALSSGALVTVADDGRVAWMIAGINQMPPG
jgi:hypothetical protein